ncbi:hypothetical protein QBC38DRAFT_460427, partial [Podospora fimiseda]
MTITAQPTSRSRSNTGTAWYSPLTLAFYDNQVLGFNMTYVWRCPVRTVQLPFFEENFTNKHLDIGVATG